MVAHRNSEPVKSFAHEKGCQVQYLVEWADSVVLKEHLQALEKNGYRAMSTKDFLQFGWWACSVPD